MSRQRGSLPCIRMPSVKILVAEVLGFDNALKQMAEVSNGS